MIVIVDRPLLVLVVALLSQWLAAYLGGLLRRTVAERTPEEREGYDTVKAAILTLLGLLIGFTFSMAVSRYDQRKNFEEGEANAIGTEYLRADLLPSADAARVRDLLRSYLKARIEAYETRDLAAATRINVEIAKLEGQLWSAILPATTAQPTPVSALVIAGMNDVLNSQGYTQASWWNRIPIEGWLLMLAIALACNMLLGFGYGSRPRNAGLLTILPIVVSISFFLIADIDSPQFGLIRVKPINLMVLSDSMRPQ